MSEFWHAITTARFSWIDMGVLIVLMALIDVGNAFVRGWRRGASLTDEDRARQRYWDAQRHRHP